MAGDIRLGNFRCNKGLTLVELLVVLAIMGIVMSVAYNFFTSNYKLFDRENDIIDAQHQAQMAMNGMVNHIIEAQRIEDINRLNSNVLKDMLIRVNDDKYIKYEYDNVNKILKKGEAEDKNIKTEKYAKHIGNCQITYLPVGTSEISKIQGLRITIKSELNDASNTLNNDVYFRNWSERVDD